MSDVTKFTYDRLFQLSILKLMIKNVHFCFKCSRHLQPTYFSDNYLGWFFTVISSHYQKFSRLPDITVLVEEINSKIVKEEAANYHKVLKDIIGANSHNVEYIKDKLTHFIRANQFKVMHYETRELYNDGQAEKAYNSTNKSIADILQVNFDRDDAVTAEDIDKILAYLRNSTVNKVSLGIPVLDEYLIGGIPKQTVSTVMAGYNSYKTTFCINSAVEAAKSGTKVLFIFCEGKEQQIVARFLSKLTRIPYHTLNVQVPDKDQMEKINKAKKFIHENIIIKKMKKVGRNIEHIYEYARDKIQEMPFGLMVVDSAQKLNPRKKYAEKRHNLAEVWDTFELMADELDIAVLASTQLNREGHKLSNREKKIVRSEFVGEAIDIAQTSETIFTLNPWGEDRLVICLDKQRDGKAGILVDCEMNMRCAITHDKNLSIKEVTLGELEDEVVDTTKLQGA